MILGTLLLRVLAKRFASNSLGLERDALNETPKSLAVCAALKYTPCDANSFLICLVHLTSDVTTTAFGEGLSLSLVTIFAKSKIQKIQTLKILDFGKNVTLKHGKLEKLTLLEKWKIEN